MFRKTMILAAAVSIAAALHADIRAVTPIAWNGNPECWQMKVHKSRMNNIATNGAAEVVFIGDSITDFWGSKGRNVWNKFFAKGKRKAINLGVSADRTEHVLWRLTEGRELDGYKAKAIVLMIGTNNAGHFPFEEEPPVDTILGIRKILEVIKEKQPEAKIILTAIFPRGATVNDPCRKRNEIVNKELPKFCDGTRVVWCDFNEKFLDARGNLSRELFSDLLHPDERGYEIWASEVIPLIDAALAAAPDEAIASRWPSYPSSYTLEPLMSTPLTAFPASNWWGKRCLEKRNEITAGPKEYDLVFVGDSITHRWERKGGEGVRIFAELKKTYKILNLGYGGDRTQHVLWRMQNGELEGYKAKLFMLMIGTNNAGNNCVDVANGTKRIIETILAKHPESKILLLPIFPRGDSPTHRARLSNDKVNRITKNFADGKRVILVDFNSKLVDEKGDTKALMDDRLHTNEKGYAIWRDAVLPYFRKYVGK